MDASHDTTDIEGPTLEERRSFLRLPLEERRRRLAEQAKHVADLYRQQSAIDERMEWQAGDIVEDYCG